MEHAGDAELAALEDLMAAIRRRHGVHDRRRGYFYRKGRALVHFHQDPTGLFADLHDGPEWRRLRVSEPEEQRHFLAALDEAITKGG
ncbi:MAG: hypothetical protein ACREFS_08995 [Acetobacteraceae bacterium]